MAADRTLQYIYVHVAIKMLYGSSDLKKDELLLDTKLTIYCYWLNSTIPTNACTYKSFIWKPRLKVGWTSAGYKINSVWLLIELGRAGGVSCEIVQTLCDACFYCHMISIKLLYKWNV